ncbi:MAG: lipid A export permease/ATP-binding protein MsbA [Pseudomonadota bacterium]|nr:lipid A export permease/ATP-binding protein MsbA [Pseudomonadota bacterium]
MSNFQVYLRLIAYLKTYWWAIILVIIGFSINAGTEVAVAKLMQFIIDAITNGDRQLMNLFPIFIILLFIVRGIGTFLGNYFSAVMARSLVYQLRVQVFNQMLRLPTAFYLANSSGYLSAKLIFDVEQVTGAATESLKTILRDGLIVTGLLVFLFYTNWKLSLTLLAVIPFIALLVRYASKRFRKLSQQVQDSMGQVSHIVTETINGYSVVKNYGGIQYEEARFEQASKENLKRGLKIVVTNSINTPAVQLLMAMAMAVVVYLALRPEVFGDTSAGEFIAYIAAAGLLSKPVRALTDINQQIQRGVAAAASVFALIDHPAEPDHGTIDQPLTGRIEFRNVDFDYPDGTTALRNFSLQINAGETIAVVGRSGAGKTTLINLLMRGQEVSRGELLFDGVPAPQLTLDCLRRQIASVGQQVILFDRSVRENIAYGQLSNKSMTEIKMATQAAYADQFIERLPKGYDTLIGEGGLSLSGGQRQRLAIARALLKDAPILVLDEATSALDNESEHYIQQALNTAMQDRTTIVIAHRLSTIEQADRIVVMDQGQIVEQGTHAELIAHNGLYAQLHRRNFDEDLPV